MYLFYNLLLIMGIPFLAAWGIYQFLFRRKPRGGLRERLGYPLRPDPPENAPVLWLHAVSVGEVHAAQPFVREWKRRHPQWRLVLSTVTDTGREAGRLRIPEADARIYFPLDFPWSVSSALRRVNPTLVVILETEIWPNFLKRLRRQGIPVFFVNGRISPRSFRRYRRLRPFIRRVLGEVSGFGMQSETDARRVAELGAPAQRIRICGNLKYDGAADPHPPNGKERRAMRKEIGLPEDGLLWAAGSIHPDEEKPVLDAFQRLLKNLPELRLVIAPRHLERVPAISARLRSNGISYALRRGDTGDDGRPPPRVLVLNTLGELHRVYRAADVAFVGGSLIPWGGQNPLEAAGQGLPLLFGAHMHNFQEAAEALAKPGPSGTPAARVIEGPLEDVPARLAEAIRQILSDPSLARAMGEQGRNTVLDQAGAARRYVDWLTELFPGGDRS